MSSTWVLATAVTILAALAEPARADHIEPATAKKFTFALVNGFRECGDPNTATQSGGIPACTPVIPELCGLSSAGSGKLSVGLIGSAAAGSQDIKFKAVAKGLANCEGQSLCIRVSFRATTDDCPEGSCTTIDVVDEELFGPPPVCCTVTNGKCAIKTTLLTALPSILAKDKNTGIKLLGCGLKSFGFAAEPPDLACGILLP